MRNKVDKNQSQKTLVSAASGRSAAVINPEGYVDSTGLFAKVVKKLAKRGKHSKGEDTLIKALKKVDLSINANADSLVQPASRSAGKGLNLVSAAESKGGSKSALVQKNKLITDHEVSLGGKSETAKSTKSMKVAPNNGAKTQLILAKVNKVNQGLVLSDPAVGKGSETVDGLLTQSESIQDQSAGLASSKISSSNPSGRFKRDKTAHSDSTLSTKSSKIRPEKTVHTAVKPAKGKEVSSSKKIKVENEAASNKVQSTLLALLANIVQKAKPLVRLKKVRVAGITHQKPIPLTKKQAETEAIKRIIQNATTRPEKSASLRLAKEFEEIYTLTLSNKTLTEIRDLHKLADANKANLGLK